MSPKVSVIIPIYNVQDYLKQCIESVLNQTLKNIEIILVNDGSTDNCKEIIEEYKSKYSNIVVLYQNNQGVSVARNLALKKASGKYIYYMDSDDFLENQCLELAFNRAEETKSQIVIFSHNEIYDDTLDGTDVSINLDVDDSKVYDGNEVADMVLNCKFIGTPWNKLFRKKCLINDGFTYEPGRYVQDWFPIFMQIHKANKIAFINKPLYNYRIRGTSTTSKKMKKNIDDYNHAASKIINYAKENKLISNSIMKFNAISLNTVIRRYFDLNKDNIREMYDKFSDTEYYKNNLTNKEILKIKDLSYRVKINLISWNLRIYHILISVEKLLGGIKK